MPSNFFIDSLTHPTLSGNWVKGEDATFSNLIKIIDDDSRIAFACAVGMPTDCFKPIEYMAQVNTSKKLIGIAPIENKSTTTEHHLSQLTEIGFKGIKIHPRWLNQTCLKHFEDVFRYCEKARIPVWLCTYYWSSAWPDTDYLTQMNQICTAYPQLKLILVHGGGVRLLEFAEFARAHPNTLLDLSLTISKYRGSSIDNDINWLINNFDRRICLGSDHPEWHPSEILDLFLTSAENISEQRKRNILMNNIGEFIFG